LTVRTASFVLVGKHCGFRLLDGKQTLLTTGGDYKGTSGQLTEQYGRSGTSTRDN